MSDRIRRASAVVIAVTGPLSDECNGDSLKGLGDRMRTMSELLLYTGSHTIIVYDGNRSLNKSHLIPRRELWDKVWKDTTYSAQLIDHHESSPTLSPLELVTVSLQYFHKRKTTEYLEIDKSYILMGLLRQRPHINRSDSAFQALARLSLAKDSNLLLKRLICLLPKQLDDDWRSLDDSLACYAVGHLSQDPELRTGTR